MKLLKDTFAIIFLTVFFIGCGTETEYIDSPPQLEIKVVKENMQSASNADVKLFSTLENWESSTGVIIRLKTDNNGIAFFTELGEEVYYFLVSMDTLNNRGGICTFSDPLQINTKRKITA